MPKPADAPIAPQEHTYAIQKLTTLLAKEKGIQNDPFELAVEFQIGEGEVGPAKHRPNVRVKVFKLDEMKLFRNLGYGIDTAKSWNA